MRSANSVIRSKSQVSVILWVLALPMILGFYALSKQGTADLQVLFTFMGLYLMSGFGILLAQMNLGGVKDKGSDLGAFWMWDVDKNGLKWIGIGLAGVIVSILIILSIGNGFDGALSRFIQIVGIIIAGMIMMLAFIKSHSILVPIVIHGTWNTIVNVIKQLPFEVTGLKQAQLSALPDIPEIGVGLFGNIADIYSESIWQYTIVATAEEFLKLATFIFVVAFLNARWKDKGLSIVVGAFVSVIFWAFLHSISAIR